MTRKRGGRKRRQAGSAAAGFGGGKPRPRRSRRRSVPALAMLRPGRRLILGVAILGVAVAVAAAGWFGLERSGALSGGEAPAAGRGAVTLAVARPSLPPATGIPRRSPARSPDAPTPDSPAADTDDAIGALIEELEATAAAPAATQAPRYDEAPEETALAALPSTPAGRLRQPGEARLPRIAIVIDDLGGSADAVRRLLALPGPVTYAFLTDHAGAAAQAETVAAAGLDVMLHLPMEPEGKDDPGSHALLTGNDEAENLRRLRWHLARMPLAVGVNNHMGSRFTADARQMRPVLQAVGEAGLFWLDSRTSSRSAGLSVAQELHLPAAQRDLFLDHVAEEAEILRQLQRAEEVAAQEGQAIAIGHPYPETLAALEGWMARAQARGFAMVGLSELIPPARPARPPQAGPEQVSN